MIVSVLLVLVGFVLAFVSALTGWGWPVLMIVGVAVFFCGLARADARHGRGPLA